VSLPLTRRQTWQNVTVREDCKKFEMYRKGNGIRKKRHQPAFVFGLSVLGEKLPTAEFILNDFGRNFLLEIERK
jgi:hypothetical protein